MFFSRFYHDAIRVLTICGVAFISTANVWAVEVDGFTQPYRDIDVAAADMGIINSISVKEGDRVNVGQLLARLNEATVEATLRIAQTVMQSRGRLESAAAELKQQDEIVVKLRELRKRGHASSQEVERAQNQQLIAAARLKTVQEEHAVKVLEYERARVQLERRHLTSPIDGIVTQIYKDRGEFVSPSDPVILKVVQLNPLLVVFSVPTEQGRKLANGQTVEVRIADAEDPAQGEVEFVSPTADPQSGTTRVRVRISNPEERLPSGAACRLILNEGSKTPADVAKK